MSFNFPHIYSVWLNFANNIANLSRKNGEYYLKYSIEQKQHNFLGICLGIKKGPESPFSITYLHRKSIPFWWLS
jgi:hypothetical protein